MGAILDRRAFALMFLTLAGGALVYASREEFAVAHAEEAPRVPKTIGFGRVTGPSPHAGVDLGRTRRSADPLPTKNLRGAWSISGYEGADVLVSNATVYVVEREVVAYDLEGHKLWEVSGDTAGVGVPALLADGTIARVHIDGVATGSRGGVRAFRRPLISPAREEIRGTGAVPLADGGFLAHWGDTLTWLDAQGQVRDSVRSSVAYRFVSPLVVLGGAAYGVTAGGAVYRIRELSEPTWVGAFGGVVTSASAFGAGALVGNVAGERVVSLDLSTGATAVMGRADAGETLGQTSANARGRVCTTARRAGQVVVLCFEGGKTVTRAPVDLLPALAGDAGAVFLADEPSLTMDDAGTVAYASRRGLAMVRADGTVTRPTGGWLCAAGEATVVPSGPGAVLVGCGREVRKFTGDFAP